MKRSPTAALLFCLLLSSCGLPAMPGPAEAADTGGPLTVEDCVRIALEKNHAVAIARNNVGSAEAATKGAWSGILPRVNANMYWNRLTQGPTEQLTLNERTGEIIASQSESQAFVSYSMGLNASQTMFSWSAVQNIAQARAGVAAARHSSMAAEHDIAYEVKMQFYSLVKAQKLLEVSEKSHERSQGQLDRAESLFELGSVAKSDVLRARVDLAQSKLDLITARNVVELEKTRLAKIMGLGPDAEIEVRADLTVNGEEEMPEDLYAEALAQRPELRAANERVKAAKAGLKSAKAGYYPSLFSFFNWRWRDDEFPNSTGDLDERYTWDVGMGFQFPIFDGMLTEGNIGSARAGLRNSEQEYSDLHLAVTLDVKTAIIALQEGVQRLTVSEEALASAQESYKLAEEQYEVGLGTILELTEAGVELTTAESQRVEAITLYKIAQALLDRARGEAVN
jgi:outer membrane protein TolC